MARRKRGNSTARGAASSRGTTRKSRSSIQSKTINVETISPNESAGEDSNSSCNGGKTSTLSSHPKQNASHKKFGKFRCLHLEDEKNDSNNCSEAELSTDTTNLTEPSHSSESEMCSNDKLDENSPFIIESVDTSSEVLTDTPIESMEIIETDANFDETDCISQEVIEIVDAKSLEEGLSKITVSEEDKTLTPDEEITEETELITEEIDEQIIYKEEEQPPVNQLETQSSEIDSVVYEDEDDTIVGEEIEKMSPSIESPSISSNETTNDSITSGTESVAPTITSSSGETTNENKTTTENVRRSSRIKTISELKTRSRGRGLVNTKAMLKQGMVDLNLSVPLPPPPVKVKQRWRRSSELEAAKEDPEMEHRLRQFSHIKDNIYLTERLSSKEAKRMTCDCFLTKEEIDRGEYGCGEDCLNRLLMIECGNYCVVGDRCTNKRFQNQKYATCEVFRTEKKGFGIRAVSEIAGGEFIMEYVGEVVNQVEFERRADVYSKDKNIHYYFMSLRADAIIDATQKGNISRFINHSCDPNAETQKWTVNGELRIGFFARRDISPFEELTFDYKFQRYGKEAQKCYCEASFCRGWIGEEPDDDDYDDDEEGEDEEEEQEEDEIEEECEENGVMVKKKSIQEKTSVTLLDDNKEQQSIVKVEKPKRKPREPRKKPKRTDIRDDTDLEIEIERLSISGIKNRAHTLALSRLFVRAGDANDKASKLLRLLRNADHPCRRLFLDYHGLRLIHTWMSDNSDDALKMEILETLASLPIPNKTMLQDSKVLSTVQKWSLGCDSESPNIDSGNSTPDVSGNKVSETETPETPMIVQTQVMSFATKLLSDWSTLKEVFRIPKKERIEQMKEHEREADRAMLDKENESDPLNNRDRYDRFNRPRTVQTLKGRESPPRKPPPNIVNPVNNTRLTKHQRRHLFAIQVAKEEEERRRNQQAEAWRNHEQQCLALGIDPRQPYIPAPVWIQQPPPMPVPVPPVPIKLPPKWKCVHDNRGRPYYYHIKIRISQWEPPEFPPVPPPIVPPQETVVETVQDDGDSTTSSSEESSSVSETSSSEDDSSDDDIELDDTKLMLEVRQKLRLSNPESGSISTGSVITDLPLPPMASITPPTKRKREALVQEIIISPRREEDKLLSKIEAKKYRETKEKLRKRKEIARAKERAERAEREKHRPSIIPGPDFDIGNDREHKIKMHFRKKMANVMVHILGPYKKQDCKIGRITNTEDFKHLAKKLTLFVMLKELKNCKSVSDLTVNDSVRLKAREFVKKYMSKYGEVYTRSKDEQQTD